MSFVPFANVPEGTPKGKITAYVTSFEADGSDPGMVPDDTPDSIPLDGTITIMPRVGTMKWPGLPKPQTSVMSALVCPVIEGDLYRPGTTKETYQDVEPGVWVIATDQPDAQPDKVQYEVRWNLTGARVQPQTTPIDVPAGGTVDLATVIPASPEPGTVQVTYTVDRERAEAAADLAEGFAGEAETAATVAVQATDGLGAPVVSAVWNDAHTVDAAGVGFMAVSLAGPATVTLTPGTPNIAQTFNLVVTQGGDHTLHFPGVLWSEGVAFVPSEGTGAKDFLTLTWDGENWWGFVAATGGEA